MENAEVSKMLTRIYDLLARMKDYGQLEVFQDTLLDYYVKAENENDNGDAEITILNFAKKILQDGSIDPDGVDKFFRKFYQAAYYKGKASKLEAFIKEDNFWIGSEYMVIKPTLQKIDKLVEAIIDAKNKKEGVLKLLFASEEFKKYAQIVQNFSKEEGENLELPEPDALAKSFGETKKAVTKYEKLIDKKRTELYNMMTNSRMDTIQSLPDEKFDAFVKQEIARVSAQNKTKANPDGQGKN